MTSYINSQYRHQRCSSNSSSNSLTLLACSSLRQLICISNFRSSLLKRFLRRCPSISIVLVLEQLSGNLLFSRSCTLSEDCKRVVSSVNRSIRLLTCKGNSWLNMINSKGPNMERCGTSVVAFRADSL